MAVRGCPQRTGCGMAHRNATQSRCRCTIKARHAGVSLPPPLTFRSFLSNGLAGPSLCGHALWTEVRLATVPPALPVLSHCSLSPSPGCLLRVCGARPSRRLRLVGHRCCLSLAGYRAGALGGKKIALRGGGGDTEAHLPNHPSRLLGRRDGRGGSGRGCPTCCAGGGGQPNIWLKMIPRRVDHCDYSNVGGEIIGGKNFFGPKFVFLRLWRQHPFLDKTKGPTRNPISPTPTPPPSAGVHVTPPPPPRRAIFRSPWWWTVGHALCPANTTRESVHLRRQGNALMLKLSSDDTMNCCGALLPFDPSYMYII